MNWKSAKNENEWRKVKIARRSAGKVEEIRQHYEFERTRNEQMNQENENSDDLEIKKARVMVLMTNVERNLREEWYDKTGIVREKREC